MTGVILSDKEVNNILNEQDKEIKSLKKENKQLKQQLSDICYWIDDKIDKLEDKYEFGQKNGFCKMHNIRYAINTLKELQNELKGDVE